MLVCVKNSECGPPRKKTHERNEYQAFLVCPLASAKHHCCDDVRAVAFSHTLRGAARKPPRTDHPCPGRKRMSSQADLIRLCTVASAQVTDLGYPLVPGR